MNRIIFINGSINSGKSTVGKLIADNLPSCAFIEIDRLREMVDWMSIDQAIPLNLENAVALIRNFAKQDLNVVVPYPLSQANYDYLVRNLEDLGVSIEVYTLAPTLEAALTNRGSRELSEQEKERIRYHYKIGIPNPKFGHIIDNSNLTSVQSTEVIMKMIDEVED